MRRGAVAVMIGGAVAAMSVTARSTAETNMADYIVEGDEVKAPLAGLTGDTKRGRAIAIDRSRGNCLACHAVPSVDEPFQGKIGPSLGGVGKRLSEGQIRLRMIDQGRLNPETLMPPYYRVQDLSNVAPEYKGRPALDAQQLEDVVAWLATLEE